MKQIVASEFQKYAHSFTKKIIWIAPLVVVLMEFLLGIGEYYQNGCYNIWYMDILPATIVLISASVVMKDKKKIHYRGILALPFEPTQIWLGKVLTGVISSFFTCMLFPLLILPGMLMDTQHIPFLTSLMASLLLFLTTLWLIPLSMFLIDHIGMPFTIIIQLGLYFYFSVFFYANNKLWLIPYAISARLMCPVIHVLPNGLSVPAGDPLLATNVILPGVVIAVLFFTMLTALTTLTYRKLEAK